MNEQATSTRNIEWGPTLVVGVGIGLILIGARGFYLRGHFGLLTFLYLGLLLVPAALLLLVTSYVLQHGKLAALMPILFAALLVRAYPSFAIALGLVVLGTIVGPALSDSRAARTS